MLYWFVMNLKLHNNRTMSLKSCSSLSLPFLSFWNIDRPVTLDINTQIYCPLVLWLDRCASRPVLFILRQEMDYLPGNGINQTNGRTADVQFGREREHLINFQNGTESLLLRLHLLFFFHSPFGPESSCTGLVFSIDASLYLMLAGQLSALG